MMNPRMSKAQIERMLDLIRAKESMMAQADGCLHYFVPMGLARVGEMDVWNLWGCARCQKVLTLTEDEIIQIQGSEH